MISCRIAYKKLCYSSLLRLKYATNLASVIFVAIDDDRYQRWTRSMLGSFTVSSVCEIEVRLQVNQLCVKAEQMSKIYNICECWTYSLVAATHPQSWNMDSHPVYIVESEISHWMRMSRPYHWCRPNSNILLEERQRAKRSVTSVPKNSNQSIVPYLQPPNQTGDTTGGGTVPNTSLGINENVKDETNDTIGSAQILSFCLCCLGCCGERARC